MWQQLRGSKLHNVMQTWYQDYPHKQEEQAGLFVSKWVMWLTMAGLSSLTVATAVSLTVNGQISLSHCYTSTVLSTMKRRQDKTQIMTDSLLFKCNPISSHNSDQKFQHWGITTIRNFCEPYYSSTCPLFQNQSSWECVYNLVGRPSTLIVATFYATMENGPSNIV